MKTNEQITEEARKFVEELNRKCPDNPAVREAEQTRHEAKENPGFVDVNDARGLRMALGFALASDDIEVKTG